VLMQSAPDPLVFHVVKFGRSLHVLIFRIICTALVQYHCITTYCCRYPTGTRQTPHGLAELSYDSPYIAIAAAGSPDVLLAASIKNNPRSACLLCVCRKPGLEGPTLRLVITATYCSPAMITKSFPQRPLFNSAAPGQGRTW
jgi:hypothetical protein